LKFPDCLETLDDAENEIEMKVDIIVDEIMHGILLKEMGERMFPPRPLSKLMKQKKRVQTKSGEEVKEGEVKINEEVYED